VNSQTSSTTNDEKLLEEIETHAVAIAREAGQIVLKHFRGTVEVNFKGKNNLDPVTNADTESEAYLKKAINEKFPDHGIIGEEGTRDAPGATYTWVLDALDGTANFINGMPLFCVSVGVLRQGVPVAGAIYTPVSHLATAGVYHARTGHGTWLDDEQVEPRAASGRPLVGLPPFYRLTGPSGKKPHERRSVGSIALEIVYAAAGIFQYTLFGRPCLWDVAAGAIIIKEVGGLVYTRSKGSKEWQPLETFLPAPGMKDPKPLHDWREPFLGGAAEVTRQAVRDLRPVRHPVRRLWRQLRAVGRTEHGKKEPAPAGAAPKVS
jgi:myo-inositol-1(or 4)-monophosphatase